MKTARSGITSGEGLEGWRVRGQWGGEWGLKGRGGQKVKGHNLL